VIIDNILNPEMIIKEIDNIQNSDYLLRYPYIIMARIIKLRNMYIYYFIYGINNTTSHIMIKMEEEFR